MTLKDVLEKICAEEYALLENTPHHHFKRAHRRAVNEVLYPNGLPKTEKKLPLKRRVFVIAAVVVLAIVTGAAVIIHENGFFFDEGHLHGLDYYVMIMENAEGAPQTIENICYDYNLPSKFKKYDSYYIEENQQAVENYYDYEGKSILIIIQSTKQFFTHPVVEGENVWEAAEIRGCKGFTITHTYIYPNGEKYVTNHVIWDCGDYVHMVVGHNLSLDEVMSIVNGMTEK